MTTYNLPDEQATDADVIVEIRGGVVQSIRARHRQTKVLLIDWDDIECGGRSSVLSADALRCSTKSEKPK